MAQIENSIQTFFPGDVVQLRSGGPTMVVSGLAGRNDHLSCIYFNQVSGKIEDIMVVDMCVKHANTTPQSPESANQMRNAPVKSSMS